MCRFRTVRIGSTGSRQDPGKVFKNKKMAGHMGQTRVTTQNLEVVSTDEDRGLILIKGAVPGSKGAWIIVRDAVKSASEVSEPAPMELQRQDPRGKRRREGFSL